MSRMTPVYILKLIMLAVAEGGNEQTIIKHAMRYGRHADLTEEDVKKVLGMTVREVIEKENSDAS